MAAHRKIMEQALREDRKADYLRYCKDHYADAVSIAQKLFPQYYRGLAARVSSGDDSWNEFGSRADSARRSGQEEDEVRILQQAVDANVDTPGTYERLCVLLSKRKEYREALSVCEKWFSGDLWKIPNSATTSLRLLERMEKLKTKLEC